MDVLSRAELLAAGSTPKTITRDVRLGMLVRLRRGLYATGSADPDVVAAVRAGGRLSCVSELRRRGIWVPPVLTLHVHHPEHSARHPRIPDIVRHWSALLEPTVATASSVSLLDALAMAAECLHPWYAVAAMDSAVQRGDVSLVALRRGLSGRSARVRALVRAVRPSAESGLETIVRMLADALGFRVAIQVRFPGIGIADIVIEEWIVVETDGSAYHDEASVAARDRRRDARHAAAGRVPLRFRYARVVYELPSVAAAIIGAVRTHRRVHNAGDLARRAESRLRALGFPAF